MLGVSVWDKSMVNAVDQAIREANLGLNPIIDGQNLRIPLPELNEERRKSLVKVAHDYAEKAKVAVRHVRRDGMDGLKKAEKDGIDRPGRQPLHVRQGAKDDGRHDFRNRPLARRQGKGNHAGLACALRIWPAHGRIEPDRICRQLTKRAAPEHVAIIMDGNGRWAKRAWTAADPWAPQGRRGGARDGAGRGRGRHPLSDAVCLFLGELAPSGSGGQRSLRPAEDLHPPRPRGTAPRECPYPHHRRSRAVCASDILPLLLEAEETTRDNTGLTLVIAFNYGSRDEIAARRPQASPQRWQPGELKRVETSMRRADRRTARHGRHSRSGSDHPHQRRGAAVELPALAGGLCRTHVRARILAGFHAARSSSRHSSVMRARDRRFGGCPPGRGLGS